MKFYAERQITINGKSYNAGDIIISHKQYPGLVPFRAKQNHNRITIKDVRKLPVSSMVMQSNPVISVVITFHNQEKFIRDCLDSFIRQTVDVPFEIIAINDSSRDKTGVILQEYEKYVRIFTVDYKTPQKSRNKGLEEALGEFIAFFDGDDWAFPDYLKKLHQKLIDNPDKGFSYARFYYGDRTDLFHTCNYLEWGNYVNFRSIVNTPTLIRAEYAKKCKWDEKVITGQDRDFTLSLRAVGAEGIAVREKLWQYRIHSNSLWGSGKGRKKMTKDHSYIQKKFKLPIKRLPYTFVSLISRPDCLDDYFNAIKAMTIPRDKCHWYVFIDSNDNGLISEIIEKTQGIHFATTRIFVTNEKPILSAGDFHSRVMRIARNMEVIIDSIRGDSLGGSDFVFMIEDDTIPPKNAFKKLIGQLEKDEKIGFIQGAEVHRWTVRRLGGAILKESAGVFKSRHPISCDAKGVVDINAGGWYCWAARTEALNGIVYKSIPDLKIGPDELFVYQINKKGYKTLMDMSIDCGHWDPVSKRYLYLKDGENCIIHFINNKIQPKKI